MPQPRKPSTSSGPRRNGAHTGGGSKSTPKKRTPARKPPPTEKLEERVQDAVEAVPDGTLDKAAAATRRLSPRDLIVLTRERIQEVVDDAVARGRMTRADGTKLVGELLSLGRRQTEDMVADLEQLLGRSREQLNETQERLLREVDRAKRVVGVGGGSVPIAGYDELTAAQVIERLDELTPAELRQLRDYERRNANRKSVLDAIEATLG